MKMKAFILSCWVALALASNSFGRIGEDEKQIEARYGKPGKDLGTRGEVHQVGYVVNEFLAVVSFVNGISQRESFAKPDTSPLTPEAIQKILAMSAADGTKWEETKAEGGDKSWARSDNKAIALFPAQGKFLSIQDANFVQPQ
jgi:hypothetical protein